MENQQITIEDLSKSNKSDISDIEIDSQASWQPNNPRSMIRIPKSKIPQRLHITKEQQFKDQDLTQQMQNNLEKISIFRTQSAKKGKEKEENDISKFKFQIKNNDEKKDDVINPYSEAVTSKLSGDMPKVFAFEVENNIRKGLQEILKPMIGQHERVVLNVTDLHTILKDIQFQINKVNRKLDQQIPLTEQIKDANQRTMKMKDEYYKHIKELKSDIIQQNQLIWTHDLKIQSIKDDRATFLFNQDQLKNEIRQFEKLCQDISFLNAQQLLEHKEKVNNQLNEFKNEIDYVMNIQDESQQALRSQKELSERFNSNLKAFHKQINQHQQYFWKINSIETIIKENQRFNGYVLPIRIQESVFNTFYAVNQGQDKMLSLIEYQQDQIRKLIKQLEVADQNVQTREKQEKDGLKVIVHDYDKINYQLESYYIYLKEQLQRKNNLLQNSSQNINELDLQNLDQQNHSFQNNQQSENQYIEKNVNHFNIQTIDKILENKNIVVPVQKEIVEQEQIAHIEHSEKIEQSEKEISIKDIKHKLKLTDLLISSRQIYKFANRISRRLLKNEKFLDKLADRLDEIKVSDISEQNEDDWGRGDSSLDFKGYNKDDVNSDVLERSDQSEYCYQEYPLQDSFDQDDLQEQDTQNKEDLQNQIQQISKEKTDIVFTQDQQVKNVNQDIQIIKFENETQQQINNLNEKIDKIEKKLKKEVDQSIKPQDQKFKQEQKEELATSNKNVQLNIKVQESKQLSSRKSSFQQELKSKKVSPAQTVLEVKKIKQTEQKPENKNLKIQKKQAIKTIQQVQQEMKQKQNIMEQIRIKMQVKILNLMRQAQINLEKRKILDSQNSIIEEQQLAEIKEDKKRRRTSKDKPAESNKQVIEKQKTVEKKKLINIADDLMLLEKKILQINKDYTDKAIQNQQFYISDNIFELQSQQKQAILELISQKEYINTLQDQLVKSKLLKKSSIVELQQKNSSNDNMKKMLADIQQSLKTQVESIQSSNVKNNHYNQQVDNQQIETQEKEDKKVDIIIKNVDAQIEISKISELQNKKLDINQSLTEVTMIKHNTNQIFDSESEKSLLKQQINYNQKESDSSHSRESGSDDSQDEDCIDTKIEFIQKQVDSIIMEFQILKNDKNWIANFQSKINSNKYKKKQAEPVKDVDELKRMVEERIEQMDLLKDEMKNELKRLQRQDFQSQNILQIQTQHFQQILDQFCNFQIRINQTDHLQQIILKVLKINHALASQDEKDRKDIYLFGAKEHTQQQNLINTQNCNIHTDKSKLETSVDQELQSFYSRDESIDDKGVNNKKKKELNSFNAPKIKSSIMKKHKILQFDNNCLSCSAQGQTISQIPQIIKAFKIACLKYKSSPVIVNNHSYQRQQLIDANGCLIYLAIKQIDSFQENYISLEKPEDLLLKDIQNGQDLHQSIQSLLNIQSQLGFNTNSFQNNKFLMENTNYSQSNINQNNGNFKNELLQFSEVQSLKKFKKQQQNQSIKILKLAQQNPNTHTLNDGKSELPNQQSKFFSSNKNLRRTTNMSSIQSIFNDNNNYKISTGSQEIGLQTSNIQTFDRQFIKDSSIKPSENRQMFHNYSQKSISPTRILNQRKSNYIENLKHQNQNKGKEMITLMEQRNYDIMNEHQQKNQIGQNQSPQDSLEMNSTLRFPIMPTIRQLLTTRNLQFDQEVQSVQPFNISQIGKQENQNNQIISRNLSVKDSILIDKNVNNRIGTYRRRNHQNLLLGNSNLQKNINLV